MRIVASAMVVLIMAGDIATLTAQSGAVEHWILTMRAPSGELFVRPIRLQWKSDSLFADFTAGANRMVGSVARDAVSAELRFQGTRPDVHLTGRRDTPGTMSGAWNGDGRRFQMGDVPSGTWDARRTVGATSSASGGGDPPEHWIVTKIPLPERLAAGSVPQSVHVELSWRGDSLVGVFPSGTPPMVGTAQGGRVDALWPDRDNRVLRLSGTRPRRDSMSGTWVSLATPPQSGTWIAARVGGSRPPRAVTYAPVKWYHTYSSTNPSELRVAPGDTIRARAQEAAVTGPGGVPAPIYVDGVLPGDLLVVRILRIRPSQLTAWSQRRLLLEWFTPDFARAAQPPAGQIWNWTLDTLAGVARLDTTCEPRCAAVTRFRDITIPLRPMVGNIGVAPSGKQAFDSPDEGTYGGNFDYKWLGEGVTLYLPAFHAGGLLSVATDMHAAQGDGELVGTGLEMNADVDFVVDVIRGANATQVRAENTEYRMAFGMSADLSQALRLANTNLADWLAQDYRLNQQELALLIGSALELDIANVCCGGTRSTVVAKIRKSILAKIRP